MLPRTRSILLLALFLAPTACRPPVSTRTIDPKSRAAPQRSGLLLGEKLNAATLQTLRLLNLHEEQEPTAVISKLNGRLAASRDEEILAAQADLLLATARVIEGSNPHRALGWYMLATARAWEYLFESSPLTLKRALDRRFLDMLEVYNLALAQYLRLRHETHGTIGDHIQGAIYEIVAVRVERRPDLYDPADFDRIIPSRALKIRGLRNHHRRDGIGARLVGVKENRRRSPIDRFLPLAGQVTPVTAVLVFDRRASGVRRDATLTFYDPRDLDGVRIGTSELPLAADFTAPYAYLAASIDLQRIARQGMVQAELALEHQGLFMLQPYDAQRIPIVMVHGLRSSPLAWAELTNDLLGDPRIRGSYQIWHYMYATSVPFLSAGRIFRDTLEDLRRTLDPSGRDPAVGSMVIIAHSMGGLLTRTLVSDSGSHLWEAAFEVPPELLKGLASDIETARQTYFFHPKPYIDRVIFIAVPHRGSDLADGFRGRLTSSFFEQPEEFKDVFRRLAEMNSEAVTDGMRAPLARGGPTSIRAMSPSHPMIRRLADLPIDDRIPFHSILGDRGRAAGEQDSGTDGRVTYDSAHLQGAESEKILPAKHDVYDHPLAIAEIKRILKQHLQERPP